MLKYLILGFVAQKEKDLIVHTYLIGGDKTLIRKKFDIKFIKKKKKYLKISLKQVLLDIFLHQDYATYIF